MAVTVTREELGERFGSTFGDRRKVMKLLGRAKKIEPKDYRARYRRGGIAKRVVRILPSWTWRGAWAPFADTRRDRYGNEVQPNRLLLAGNPSPILDELMVRFRLPTLLFNLDVLAEMTGYACIVLEGGGNLEQPLEGNPEGWSVFGADVIEINGYTPDGRPKAYRLNRTGRGSNSNVDASRVIHYANGDLDSTLHGEPILEPVWDILDDIEKTSGADAESTWQGAVPDLHADIPTEEGSDPDPDAVKDVDEQLEEYQDSGLTRFVRTQGGVTIEPLASSVTSGLSDKVETRIKMICATYEWPYRIFEGSERGELASTQDLAGFQEDIDHRRQNLAVPLTEYVVHSLAQAFGFDLLSGTEETPAAERLPLPVTIQWQPWQVMKTPAQDTADLTAQVDAIDKMVRNGTLSTPVALKLLPERWFGPEDEREAPLEDDDPLNDAGGTLPTDTDTE